MKAFNTSIFITSLFLFGCSSARTELTRASSNEASGYDEVALFTKPIPYKEIKLEIKDSLSNSNIFIDGNLLNFRTDINGDANGLVSYRPGDHEIEISNKNKIIKYKFSVSPQ